MRTAVRSREHVNPAGFAEETAVAGRLGLVDPRRALQHPEAIPLEHHRVVGATARDVLAVAAVAGNGGDGRPRHLITDGAAPTSAGPDVARHAQPGCRPATTASSTFSSQTNSSLLRTS